MLLQIRDLTVEFATAGQWVRAVDGVSLALEVGQTLGLVGESGSGKTTLGLALARLLQEPPALIRAGRVLFEGQDVLQMPRASLERLRGRRITYVFQEPSTSLNPVLTIGQQLVEMLERHTDRRGAAARQRAMELLEDVGLPAAKERLPAYPHELSGGMKQRVMIAMAIASHPSLVVADEPTTALDVTIERQIVQLLRRLVAQLGLSLLIISHNIRLVEQLAGRIAVMRQGRIVEEGETGRVLSAPQHAYTRQLLAAEPRIPSPAGDETQRSG